METPSIVSSPAFNIFRALIFATAAVMAILLSGCASRAPTEPVARPGAVPPPTVTAPEPTPVPTAPAPRPYVQPAPTAAPVAGSAVLALLSQAQAHQAQGRLVEASATLERALRIEPRNAVLWHELAGVRLEQGQPGQAENLAAKSNSLAGGDDALRARNWRLIASARRARGDTAGARNAEDRADDLK